MSNTEAHWCLQGMKCLFPIYCGGHFDNNESPGFCKQIFLEDESPSYLPSHTLMLYLKNNIVNYSCDFPFHPQ